MMPDAARRSRWQKRPCGSARYAVVDSNGVLYLTTGGATARAGAAALS